MCVFAGGGGGGGVGGGGAVGNFSQIGGGGGGGGGLGRGRSLVNFSQIGEGQTCFIRNRGRATVFLARKKLLHVA